MALTGSVLDEPIVVTAPRLLTEFPNYATSAIVEEAPADLTPEAFYRDYVLRHRPCVLRGAALHWPAVSRWDSEYLRARLGEQVLGGRSYGVLYEPLVEYSASRLTAEPNAITFSAFLDQVADVSRPRVQAYSEYADHLGAVHSDLGEHRFFDPSNHPPREYGNRYFMSRRGYTDWHVHSGDDTITSQLVGSKEMLLLPPDNAVFTVMMRWAKKGVWKSPEARLDDAFRALRPVRVLLEPGDVIYIPMHWWHAVESLGEELNVTHACVFATPARWVADLRMANVRFSILGNLLAGAVGSWKQRTPRPFVREAYHAIRLLASFPAALHHRPRRQRWST